MLSSEHRQVAMQLRASPMLCWAPVPQLTCRAHRACQPQHPRGSPAFTCTPRYSAGRPYLVCVCTRRQCVAAGRRGGRGALAARGNGIPASRTHPLTLNPRSRCPAGGPGTCSSAGGWRPALRWQLMPAPPAAARRRQGRAPPLNSPAPSASPPRCGCGTATRARAATSAAPAATAGLPATLRMQVRLRGGLVRCGRALRHACYACNLTIA